MNKKNCIFSYGATARFCFFYDDTRSYAMLKKKYRTEDEDKEDLFLDDSANETEDWPNVDHLDADDDGYVGNDLHKEGIHSYPLSDSFDDDFDYKNNLGDYDNFDYPDDEDDESNDESNDESSDESDDFYDDDEDDDDNDFYHEDYPYVDEEADFSEYLDYDEDNDNELLRRARKSRRQLDDERELDFDFDNDDED